MPRIYNLVMCGRCNEAPVFRYASGFPLCIDCYYDLSETPDPKPDRSEEQ